MSRKASVYVLVVLVVFLISTLSVGVYGETSKKPYEGQKITLFAADHPDIIDPIRDMLPKFEEMTGIKVNIETVPEGEHNAKEEMILSTGSDAYDVFNTASVGAMGRIKAGWYVPIGDLLGSDFDYSDFPEKLLDLLSEGGQLYGLPIRAETIILMYNKEILDKYGVNVPTTLDEFAEAAKKLTIDIDGDGKFDHFGTAVRGAQGQGGYTFTFYFRNMGGKFFDTDMSPLVNSSEGIKALDYYVDMGTKYAPRGSAVYTWEDVFNSLQLGRSAMIIESSIQAGIIEDPEKSTVVGKCGYAIPPSGPEINRPDLKCYGYFISNFSKHKEAATEFIKWATSKEVQQYAFDRYKFSALTRNSVLDYAYEKAPFFKAIKDTMAIGDIYFLPPIPEQPAYYMAISDAVSYALAGTKSSKDALDEANERIRKILDDAGYFSGKKEIPEFIRNGQG